MNCLNCCEFKIAIAPAGALMIIECGSTAVDHDENWYQQMPVHEILCIWTCH